MPNRADWPSCQDIFSTGLLFWSFDLIYVWSFLMSLGARIFPVLHDSGVWQSSPCINHTALITRSLWRPRRLTMAQCYLVTDAGCWCGLCRLLFPVSVPRYWPDIGGRSWEIRERSLRTARLTRAPSPVWPAASLACICPAGREKLAWCRESKPGLGT